MVWIESFFWSGILSFLLIFVVTFAIFQKSKILGEGKAQMDAMVALVIGLILVGFKQPREIVVGLMPWVAVGVAVILVFLILYGFVAGDLSGKNMPRSIVIGVGVLAIVFTIGVVLYVTGLGAILKDYFSVGGDSSFWINLGVGILIVGAIVWVIWGSKPKKEEKKDKKD